MLINTKYELLIKADLIKIVKKHLIYNNLIGRNIITNFPNAKLHAFINANWNMMYILSTNTSKYFISK